ncbi:MAG TPA: DinB family protein [Mucilaginibacter sp.]|jgi:uncharacterized damage-inducible protein DinB|nr:DinB family protein [Mucilaginibacter sp.]
MKKLLLLALFVVVTGFRNPVNENLTPAERKFAIDYLNQTRARVLKDIKGLSPAQLNFRADSTSWSVAECVEHIALAETNIWNWLQGALQQPAAPDRLKEERYTPHTLIRIVTDRTQNKATAPSAFQPEGKFSDLEAAIKAFNTRRDSTIAYLRSTTDDLKDHFIVHPQWGTLDLYQGFIMLSAHCARHTLQLEEVMANPNFPKQ